MTEIENKTKQLIDIMDSTMICENCGLNMDFCQHHDKQFWEMFLKIRTLIREKQMNDISFEKHLTNNIL